MYLPIPVLIFCHAIRIHPESFSISILGATGTIVDPMLRSGYIFALRDEDASKTHVGAWNALDGARSISLEAFVTLQLLPICFEPCQEMPHYPSLEWRDAACLHPDFFALRKMEWVAKVQFEI